LPATPLIIPRHQNSFVYFGMKGAGICLYGLGV
jgi:hypothetical protein